MQLKAGDLFDKHYRLIRELGNGGFSEVWLAEDFRAHSLKVALKIYASAQAKPDDVETFIKKFELVYNLNHTHLLPPNACGEFNGMLYLVLRYCERGSSSALAGNMRETEAWHFLHDVACGLEYLHQKNIIHQDIKPDNVLITGDNRYVITDFDISAKARTTRRLGADAPAGTSAYMSPERFGSVSAPIKASDIWALGVSLYELITTDLPFGELGGLNQKNGAEAQPIKNPVSKALKDIIALCLQKEPWDRPTAEEIRTWCDLHSQKGKIRFDKKHTKHLQAEKRNFEWLWGVGFSFKLKQYTISASAGTNGTINPSGSISVTHGGSRAFSFSAASGYEISQVLIDGVNNSSAVASGNYTFSSVTANHTITVSFKLKQYTITATAGTNGIISPSGSVSVTHGSSRTFSFTPSNSSYEINQVFVDGYSNITAAANGYYTFSDVTADHTITVSFKQKAVSQYTISASAGVGGSINPNGSVASTHNSSRTFYFYPNAGYEISQILVDNQSVAIANSYTFSNVTANHSIVVSFRQKQYTISASASAGGSISPSGSISIAHGSSRTFSFSPNIGYEISQILVDNQSIAIASSYTFSNVTANHTIVVSFKQKQYTLSASASTGGTINPSGSIVITHNGSRTFSFIADIGYELNQVLIDGVNNSSAVANKSYTFSNVTASHTIVISFKLKQYTLSASAGSNGSISPSGVTSVTHGSSQTFTFQPNSGYEVRQIIADDQSVAVANSYTFYSITANHTLSVTFQRSCIPNLVIQIWDDVLSVINQLENNGGYTFTAYQWQRNGVDISGETSGNLYVPDGPNGSYTVRLTTSTGETLFSCPIFLQPLQQSPLHAYPNPTSGLLTLESSKLHTGDPIEIYTPEGTFLRRYPAETSQTTLDLSPLPKGVYILKVGNQRMKILKIN